MNEILSIALKTNLCLTKVITLITTTKQYLRDIVKQCKYIDNDLHKNIKCKIVEIKSLARLIEDESKKKYISRFKEVL